jgi:uncharacterized metal-binding protein
MRLFEARGTAMEVGSGMDVYKLEGIIEACKRYKSVGIARYGCEVISVGGTTLPTT